MDAVCREYAISRIVGAKVESIMEMGECDREEALYEMFRYGISPVDHMNNDELEREYAAIIGEEVTINE